MDKAIMRILVTIVAIILCVPLNAQTPRCNVGADPVNKDRVLTVDEEVVINPADQSIVYGSGNGRNVSCIIQAGVPVVIDRATGKAKWVYGCGNPIVTPWIPKRIPLPETPTPQTPEAPAPATSSSSLPPVEINNINNIMLPPTPVADVPVPSGRVTNNYGPYSTGWSCGRGCKTIFGVAILVGVVGGVYAATRGHDSTPNGVPPGGVTGLPFILVVHH
jgi:hypothetical protein